MRASHWQSAQFLQAKVSVWPNACAHGELLLAPTCRSNLQWPLAIKRPTDLIEVMVRLSTQGLQPYLRLIGVTSHRVV